MYRLIALDIDGTLIPPHGTSVSPTVREAIAAARAAGVKVVLCTGRSWQESEELADEAGCDRVMVAQGGAALADLDLRRNTRLWEFPTEVGRALVAELEDAPVGLMLFAGSRLLVNEMGVEVFKTYPSQGFHRCKEIVERPSDYLRAEDLPLSKVYAQGDPAVFPPLMERVRQFPEVELTTSALYNFEMVPVGVDKGTGLTVLAGELGIPMEEVIAIGDSDNDRGMLTAVGMPVAMGNATDQIKAIARHITASAWEDGVARAIRDLLEL